MAKRKRHDEISNVAIIQLSPKICKDITYIEAINNGRIGNAQ